MRLLHFIAAAVLAAVGMPAAAAGPEFDAGWIDYHAAEKLKGAEADRLAQSALRHFEAGCANNDADACATIVNEGYLTQFYKAEVGTRRQAAANRAAQLYSASCGQMISGTMTEAHACVGLADLVRSVRNGDWRYPANERVDGLPAYVAKAADIFLYKCSHVGGPGATLDCQAATSLLAVSDPARAGELRSALCKADSDFACHELGRLSKSEQTSLAALDARCRRKDGAACFTEGALWYQEYKFDPQHDAKARAAFAAGCDADDVKSCSTAGGLLVTGPPETRDLKGGLLLMEKGCKLSKDPLSISCRNAERVRQAMTKPA